MQRRYSNSFVQFLRWLLILIFLILLEAAVRTGMISSLFVAPPSESIMQMGRDLIKGEFIALVGLTLYEIAVAFVISTIVGVAAGYLLWRLPRVGIAYDPLLAGLFSSPIILLYPIFVVIFGRTPAAVIAQGIAIGILPIILFTRQAFLGISPILLKVGASLSLSRKAVFRHILLPAAAPTIFTGLRLGLTYMLISIVSMEYIVQTGGLGKIVADTYLRFRMDELYSSIAYVVILSAAFIYITYRGEQMVRRG